MDKGRITVCFILIYLKNFVNDTDFGINSEPMNLRKIFKGRAISVFDML